MKKILGVISLVLVLNLVGCKTSVSPNGDTDLAKTKTEDKVKINSELTKTENEKNKVKQQSKKEEYKIKLDTIKSGLKNLEKKESSGTTKDMREAADERYKRWDAALNETYNVLKSQLSASDMKKLQSEEIQWIASRDAKAKEAASEMKGGTMEPIIYTNSLADITKNRCYELVEKYMQ